MAERTGHIADLKQRLIAELKRDKKRTAVMGVLFIVAVIVVGHRLIDSLSPSELRAAGEPGGTTAPAPNPLPIATVVQRTERPNAPERSAYVTQLDRTIRRDIFRPDPGLFPAAGTQRTTDVRVTTASARDDAAERERAVREAARSLALQSTILGNRPTAIINGEVAAVGSQIGGFCVVAIHRRSCDLEKDGVQIKLLMKE